MEIDTQMYLLLEIEKHKSEDKFMDHFMTRIDRVHLANTVQPDHLSKPRSDNSYNCNSDGTLSPRASEGKKLVSSKNDLRLSSKQLGSSDFGLRLNSTRCSPQGLNSSQPISYKVNTLTSSMNFTNLNLSSGKVTMPTSRNKARQSMDTTKEKTVQKALTK